MLHLTMIDQSCLLHSQTPPVKDGEIWNAAHVVASSQVRVLFGIDFQHDSLARHFPGGPCDLRRRHAAGTAPRRPEIHQHGHPRVGDDLIEFLAVNRERLIDSRNRRLASAALPCISQVFGRYTVLYAALVAKPDHVDDPVN